MNIFYTSKCPVECAKNLDDLRVQKMVVETAQILSTAIRVKTGKLTEIHYINKSGKHKFGKWYMIESDKVDIVDGEPCVVSYDLYAATHVNHPSNVWARENRSNYQWLLSHFDALCEEYADRNKSQHKTSSLLYYFNTIGNINAFIDKDMTTPPDMTGHFSGSYIDITVNYKKYLAYKHANDVRPPRFYGEII